MVCIINFTFSCQECWKSHFRASKFQNFLGGACPQTALEKVAEGHLNSHSRLLLYGQTPTSNLIESPENAQYTVKNVPVFLYAVTMLIFQIKRIISSEKWFHYIITFFFLKMPQIWVGGTTLNGEKKEDGLMTLEDNPCNICYIGGIHLFTLFFNF